MLEINKNTGILAMVVTAFLWSLAGLFIKMIDWNPIQIAGSRSFIASFVILAFLRRPKITLSFQQVIAAISLSVTMLLFVSANKFTTAANAILLQYFAPIVTAFLGAALLKERPKPEHFLAMPIVAAGLILMFMDQLGGGNLFGNVLALLSAFAFSSYFVFMRKQKNGSPLESALLGHWLTAGICIVYSFFIPLPRLTLLSLGAILVLGIIQIGFAAILFTVAIKRISAVQANLIAVIEPVFNPLWVFLVLGETPGYKTLIGGAIVIAAVTVASIVSAKQSGTPLRPDLPTIAKNG
jgi:drug/metabolite transporter (DMT)-like permease